MKRLFLWLALLATTVTVTAQPAKIIIIRHAEKMTGEGDEAGLTVKGEERAAALVPYLTQTRGLVKGKDSVVLFATRIAEGKTDNHTHETLAPLAARLGVEIHSAFANSEYQKMAKFALNDPSCKGKTLVICWTHAYIPKLVGALGIDSNLGDWDKNVFDRILTVTGTPEKWEMVNAPQRLLFGDSQK